MTELRYPLNDYQLTPRQEAEQEYLNQRIERDCMRGLGFDFLPGLTNRVDQSVATKNEFRSRRYGITNVSIARMYGYRLSAGTTGSGSPQSAGDLPQPQLAALTDRASGNRNGGCAGKAARILAIGTVFEADAQAVTRIGQEAFLQAQSDPRVQTVFAAWSRCMASSGYSYPDPFQVAADPRWDAGTLAPNALELAVARTDISCKVTTNLLGVAFAVESGYQNAEIRQNATTLSRVKKNLAVQAQRLPALMKQYG